MFNLRLIFSVISILMIFVKSNSSLKCRTEDGPSDGELKRVARSCMRKFGDVAFAQNSQQQQQQTQLYQQQLQHQQSQGRYRQRVTNRENHGYNYEDSEESDNDDFDDDNYRNYNRPQHGYNNNNNNERGGGNNDDRQRNRNRNNSNNRTSNGNGNNNWNYSNQRNPSSNLPNNRGNNNNNNNNNRNKNTNNNSYNNSNQNNSFSDVACIVHCFFAEMHMLNNDDYPDRHKMLYILTKDIRDRELRNFYTDTIQECFRYLENQRRREKCQFSRDLITCMTEYAKGNCDDWNEFNMMFN